MGAHGCLQTLANWSINLTEIEEAIGNAQRGPRGGKRGPQPHDPVSMTGLRPLLDYTPQQRRRPDEAVPGLDDLMDKLAAMVLEGFNNMWPTLRAQEIVLEEFAATFGGIDPLKPAHRKRLTKVREGMEELAECLALYDFKVEWREPDSEWLALVRSTVPAMRNMMG